MMFMSGGKGWRPYHYRRLCRTGRKHLIQILLWSPETDFPNILVYILYVHFYKWSTNNFYFMLKSSEPSLNNNKNLSANFRNNPGGVVLFVRKQQWFTVCETVASFSLFPQATFFSKSLGNIFYVVHYSLLAAYRRMISSPSTLVATLFTSHVETALVDQSAQLKKVNIRSLVTSHMEDLEQWLRMSPPVLNLGQSCSTIINIFAINGALREKHKGSKINLWGIRWE